MARGDRLFAKVEVSFILRDARFRSLPEECRGCYLALWALAVETRQEVLSVYASRTSYVAQVSGYGHKTVQKLLRKCKRMDTPLVTKDPNTQRITVWGVTKHHPRLFPKTSPIGDCMGTNWVVDGEGEGEGEGDGDGEGREPAAPVSPPAAAILSVFPNLKNPEGVVERCRSNLRGAEWDWGEEARACRFFHERKHPQKKHNWALALANWAKFHKPSGNGTSLTEEEIQEALG